MANIDIPIGTLQSPAQTLINSAVPGDSIRFQRGGTFVGKLDLNDSGNVGSRITVTSYGSGADPILTTRLTLPGWDTPGNWTDMGGNVWRKALAINSQDTNFRIWLNGIEYNRSENAAGVNVTKRTSYNTNIIHQLYVYATSNPATFYTSIEYNGIDQCALLFNNHSYITLQHLNIRGGCGASVDVDFANNIIIEHCNIGLDAGKIGIRQNGDCDNVEIRYVTLDSGDRLTDDFLTDKGINDGIYMKGGATNWRIHNCWGRDWGHSCVELSNIAGTPTAMTGNWVYDNLFTADFVDYCRGISVDSVVGRDSSGNKVFRNYILNTTVNCQLNCPDLEFTYNIINGTRNSPTGEVGIGRGLFIAGYSNTSPINMKIYNNVIANCESEGLRILRSAGYNEPTGNLFKNNIFYNNGVATPNGYEGAQIVIIENGADIDTNTFQSNLLYCDGVTDRIVYDNRNAANVFMTIAEFNARNGVDSDVISGNISADPNFANPDSDFSLQTNSPAEEAGLDLGGSFNTGLKVPSVWPDAVLNGLQSTDWNMGAYIKSLLPPGIGVIIYGRTL